MNKNEKLQRAELARQIKDNPLYNEALMQIRSAYVRALSNVKKCEGYENDLMQIHDSLQNLDRLERVIDGYFDSGKVAVNERGQFNDAV